MDSKIILEEKIRCLAGQLADQREGSLVDSQGFPLPGLDIYSIRTARHELAKAQTDLITTMKEIEKLLPEALASGNKFATKPFATITKVEPKSLAERLKLHVYDCVLQLDNVYRYEDLSKHTLGDIIQVKVLRQFEIFTLSEQTKGFSRIGAMFSKY